MTFLASYFGRDQSLIRSRWDRILTPNSAPPAGCIFKGELFALRKVGKGFVQIELQNFLFCQVVSCDLQEPCVQSGKANVVANYTLPHQFNQLRADGGALSCKHIELKVGIEHILSICQATQGYRRFGLFCIRLDDHPWNQGFGDSFFDWFSITTKLPQVALKDRPLFRQPHASSCIEPISIELVGEISADSMIRFCEHPIMIIPAVKYKNRRYGE